MSLTIRPIDLASRTEPSATYRWGWCPIVGNRLHAPDALWYKTKRAARSAAINLSLGPVAFLEYSR